MNNERYRKIHRALAWLWLAAILAAMAFLLLTQDEWRQRLDTDLLSLLPRDERKPEAEAALAALASRGERQLVLLVGSDDEKETRRAARTLRESLAALPGRPLQAQSDATGFESLRDFYFPYRHGLITDADRDWLATATSEAGMRRALGLAYATFSPSGMAWRDDPFGFFGNWLLGLGEASPLRPQEGELMVERAGRSYAALLYRLDGSAFSSDFQEMLSVGLRDAEKNLRRRHPEVRLLRAGVVLHAAAAARQARAEMSMIGFGSLAGTLFLIGFVFRSARALRLIAISLAAGAVAALGITLSIFEHLHLLTLVFGVSLIGVAVDYAILVFAQHLGSKETVWARHRRLLPTLALVLLTPSLAYLGLTLTPFPGLKQMALFAICGIVGAWVSVVLWYPYLLPETLPVPASARSLEALLRRWPCWHGTRGQWLAALGCALFLGGGLYQLRADDDIRSLVNSDGALLKEHIEVAGIMGLPSPAQMFLISAATPEALLQAEEALIARLRPLIAAGEIGGYDAISRWLPSRARQQAVRQRLADRMGPVYPPLAREMELKDLAPEWLREQRQAEGLLTPEAWLAAPAVKPFRYLWLAAENADEGNREHYSSIVLLKGIAAPHTAATLAQLGQLTSGNVQWIDKTRDISAVMKRYRIFLSWIVGAACLLTPLLLYPFFRRDVWRVVAPALIAGLATLAAMGWLGIPVQLLCILALLLMLGMGVDYAIFLHARQHYAHTLLAATLAAALTLLSFGLLALSSTPALYALGFTATVGIMLSWLLTPFFRRREVAEISL